AEESIGPVPGGKRTLAVPRPWQHRDRWTRPLLFALTPVRPQNVGLHRTRNAPRRSEVWERRLADDQRRQRSKLDRAVAGGHYSNANRTNLFRRLHHRASRSGLAVAAGERAVGAPRSGEWGPTGARPFGRAR